MLYVFNTQCDAQDAVWWLIIICFLCSPNLNSGILKIITGIYFWPRRVKNANVFVITWFCV